MRTAVQKMTAGRATPDRIALTSPLFAYSAAGAVSVVFWLAVFKLIAG